MSALGEEGTFDFSIIVPIYNMEQFLAECIESVIGQTCGFDRIQLILVNDGSQDASAAICQKYQQEHPQNIVFIDQENGGVSSARNRGLQEARGTYINFLDADDMWSKNACACALAFFEEHPDVKMAAARHRFFGRVEEDHALSYKFKADTVIDIFEVYDYPHLSFSNVFVLASLLSGMSFNTDLQVSEDFVLFNSILMDVRLLGLMSAPSYLYRKREERDSAIDTSHKNRTWYLTTTRQCFQALFDLSKDKFGYILPYVQYSVMYDLQSRLRKPFCTPLDSAEFEEYRQVILALLSQIDDSIILSQRALDAEQKLSVLALKRGVPTHQLKEALHYVNGAAYLDSLQQDGRLEHFAEMPPKHSIRLLFVTAHEKTVTIEGLVDTIFPAKSTTVRVKTEHGVFDAKLFAREDLARSSFFEKEYSVPCGFEVTIPYSKSIRFQLFLNGHIVSNDLKAGKFFPIPKHPLAYGLVGKYVLTWEKGLRVLSFKKRDSRWKKKREFLYEKELWKEDKECRPLLGLRRKALAARGSKKQVWLISDRIDMAGDNGEYLFAYLQEHPMDDVDTYFVIRKDSPDYERMAKIGNVVEYGSKRHLQLHLQASRVISSAANEYVINPFGAQRVVVRDLERFKFVFLQRGVTQGDHSSQLRRWSKNISLIVASSPREAQSFCENPRYGYGSSIALQSGLCRHDRVLAATDKMERKLVIAPTWRKRLVGKLDAATGTRERRGGFTGSEYFKFYSALINDSRIKGALEQNGFTMELLLHPAMSREAGEFESDFCNVVVDCNYINEYASAAVWVTDYSSTAFDFALLKRPVVYIQENADEFFMNHTYKRGYFDYERDGFGPVVRDYEAAVSAIIEKVGNPVMDEVYKQRVDDFFVLPEKPRCQVVAEAIRDLQ